MSHWYEPKKENLSLSDDEKEVHVYLDQDDFGAIWVSLKVKDLKDLLSKLG